MNEEEKQAIEYWKTHMEILHCNTQIASEYYIKVLLDLVEKQQKEIEDLKFKYQARKDRTKVIIEKQQKEIKDLTETKKHYEKIYKDIVSANKRIYDVEIIESMCDELANSISKDKIKELKEKVEKEMISNPYDFSYMINELLGE